jgi:sterol 3beta-glucosyltransferase
MYAVIHHGGSGTTHTAIKYGCASMIVPHILDQHLWNNLLSQLELGPKGMPIKKFTAKRFEEKLLDILQNPGYKENAERIGNKMKEEKFDDILIKK